MIHPMETLANLESFIRSAECGSFSAAARRLGVTPAAVSRNVANLGVRLFHRTSRSLTLTEDGERFLASVSGGLESIQSAIAGVKTHAGKPVGVLKVSMPLTFGVAHVLPSLPDFLERYPDVDVDWSFENRRVDLIGEGFDAARRGSPATGAAACHRGGVAGLSARPAAAVATTGAGETGRSLDALGSHRAFACLEDAQPRGSGGNIGT
jgi:DNA-binding transcriptional LysR family regulator